MDINVVINDYIENFDTEIGNFNDFMIMAQDYRNVQELESLNNSEITETDISDLPF